MLAVNLWSFLETHVERTPDKTLLRYQDVQQSYADFHKDAVKAAGALSALGIRAGSSVCLMLGNSPDYLKLWFGLARLGAAKVPVNVHLKGEGLAYVIDHSAATVLVIEADLLSRVLPLRDAIPRLQIIVVRGESSPTPPPCLRWSDLLAQTEGSYTSKTAHPEAVHAILYTSGTTGSPKGVMLSHDAYLNSARAFAEQFVKASANDTFYTCLPLFHINAQAHTVLPAIGLNATMAIGNRFSASGFWDEICHHQVTIFNSLASMIPILCKQPPNPRDQDHQARLTACAATPKDVWLEFEERFGVRIIEGYGLTETAGFCVSNSPDNVRVGSIGMPMDFVEAQIIDQEGREAKPGRHGEIVLLSRTPHAFMEGYFKMPVQTNKAMQSGWFRSGDMGYADADGYLHFVDRIKQSIRRRGENISSWEVEKIVNAHPKVLESAAVGVPSAVGEEEVKICIVPRLDEAIDPLDIIRWCEERMAYFMVPRYVDLRDALPKTATERVEKYKLKQEGFGRAWDREAAEYILEKRS